MHEKEYIEMDIADAIMERPHGFHAGNRQFYIYPSTLGKTYLVNRIIQSLGADENMIAINPFMEALRICREKRDSVCLLLSYCTSKTKEEVFDRKIIKERTTFFAENLSDEDMAQLLIIVFTSDKVDSFIKHLGIDREHKEREKVSKAKKNDNTFTFGGKSIYGSLIDVACERYGWTMEYVVWGISYANLRMLMADIVTSIYLTDDEMKKARIKKKSTFINGDSKENIAKIMSMRWD